MELSQKDIDRLHNKFIAGTISRTEKKKLYSQFKDIFTYDDGTVDYGYLNEFLVTSHKSYGKPKNGIIEII